MATNVPLWLKRFATASALSAAGFTFAAAVLGYTYNSTPSLPVGVYRIHPLDRPLRRADVVGFCLDSDAARTALYRGYVHPQGLEPIIYGTRCPDGAAVIGKPIAGIPGDTIDVAVDGVRVNGTLLARSRASTRDRAGRVLPSAPHGRTVLRTDEYWVQSQHAQNSYDSRIYGPVSRNQILDLRVAVLVRSSRTD